MNKSLFKLNSFWLHKVSRRLKKQLIKHNFFLQPQWQNQLILIIQWATNNAITGNDWIWPGGVFYSSHNTSLIWKLIHFFCSCDLCSLALVLTHIHVWTDYVPVLACLYIDSELLTPCVCHQRLLSHPGPHLVRPKWGIGSEVSLLRFPNTVEAH